MDKVFAYIDAHQDEYISLLKAFCSQPSVSAQNLGMKEMAQTVQNTLSGLGVKNELLKTDGYPIVYGELQQGQERTLTFYNHYDVQPPEPLDQWNTPPFTPTVIDGRIYARGVADNKGSFLSRVCAIDAYQKVYGTLPVNVKFITEGEEEVGSPHLDSFRVNYPDKLKTDGIVWEGGSKDINRGPLQVTLGYKGLCYLELRCRGANTDVHSAKAAIVPSPAWRLINALGTMKNEKDEITVDHYLDCLIPPTAQDMAYLENLTYDEEATKKSLGIPAFINNLTGIPLKEKWLYQPTLNIAGFETGYTGKGDKTVLPCYAMCKMDLRLVPGQDAEQAYQLVRAHLDRRGYTDIEVIKLSGKNPFRTDNDSRLVQASLKNAEEIYGMNPSVYRSSPGTTAMGTFCGPTGIPAVSFGIDHAESNIHAPNENIYLEDFINGIKMTAAVMLDFGAKD